MYLYGASGHAKVIIDILSSLGIRVEALVDDNPGIDVLSSYPVLHEHDGLSPFIISIGDNEVRKKIAEKVHSDFAIAIHPSAIVSPSAEIGEGSVVMQGAIVQAYASIGKHCIVNTGASVDHECVIRDFVHLSPHCTLCGNVIVGEGTWIGAGAVVKQGIKIGCWCTVGAGAVVVKDVEDGATVVGVPARNIKSKEIGMGSVNKGLMGGGRNVSSIVRVYVSRKSQRRAYAA